jgi:metal-responsive CopG/Arc/MetJ family transcriptional regulator
MKKEGKIKRIKCFFTMEEELNKIFEKYIEEKYLDRSKLIEGLISEYLKKNMETDGNK